MWLNWLKLFIMQNPYEQEPGQDRDIYFDTSFAEEAINKTYAGEQLSQHDINRLYFGPHIPDSVPFLSPDLADASEDKKAATAIAGFQADDFAMRRVQMAALMARKETGDRMSDLETLYQSTDHEMIVKQLIQTDLRWLVTDTLYDFEDIDVAQTIKKLIISDDREITDEILEGAVKKEDVDLETADLLRIKQKYGTLVLAAQYDYFEDYDYVAIIEEVFEHDAGWSYAYILEKLPEDSQRKITGMFVANLLSGDFYWNEYVSSLTSNLSKFEGLGEEVVTYLIDQGCEDAILANPSSFACDLSKFDELSED